MQSHLNLQQYYPSWQSGHHWGLQPEHSGQFNNDRSTTTSHFAKASNPASAERATHMSLGRLPDQHHLPSRVTAQVLEAVAARLTGNNHTDAQSFFC